MNSIVEIELWYSPLAQLVVLDMEVFNAISSQGVEFTNAEFVEKPEYSSGHSRMIFSGVEGEKVLETIDRLNLFCVKKGKSVPRFHEEAWQTLNRISKNAHYKSKETA